ncbi:flavodoxin domain-containing protein [Ohessyouella blattaphilus]|uniref:Flavodoxin domain-containing protein n=1 Tax=Ohessyouella blattaphilus TaxID=2949333 RepID=A0ABT1EJ71_9FIRM|nr:flavodoxin domain-containing protein [Ohessyouella blattaphilus]MCP1110755.1 flavodoxin domain-containing protein [Ohessyouella blattaphilus]MCR8564149.1 flavodoxin domain-containing protein [Ohessyouella blattaphilus]MDL2249674.1 flavodoxin domain-containing protein [Lachnospiraceae bacterium OttesenSCG-928-J05]
MKNIAVTYKTHYGTTKQYAQWIAEELGATLLEQKEANHANLQEYDLVIHGGGLYASGILGIDLVVKNPVNNLIVFTVGMANPETTDYTEIIHKNIPEGLREKTKIFHLRGGMDYGKLSVPHRAMMAMMKKMTIDKKSEAELTAEDIAFRDTYGGNVNFTDKATIAPLILYVRGL